MIELSSDTYLRERLDPRPGDEFYIPLADVLLALNRLTPFGAARVLDYGCGGSPYRSLFTGEYLGADIESNPRRQLTLSEGSRLPADVEGFDLVLSTQVLEHVEDPAQYLDECMRVLKPGGDLVLSTHGLFEDHGSPNDYWRWTAEGLTVLVEQHGFEVSEVLKITTGPRAAMFMLERELRMMGPGRNVARVFPTLFAVMRLLGPSRLHRYVDHQFEEYRVRAASEPIGRYVGVALRARKPQG